MKVNTMHTYNASVLFCEIFSVNVCIRILCVSFMYLYKMFDFYWVFLREKNYVNCEIRNLSCFVSFYLHTILLSLSSIFVASKNYVFD